MGTMDVQGDLDMSLRVLYGRDKLHFRYVSDALREASGKFLIVRVLCTPSYPKFKLVPLPEAADVLKSISSPNPRMEATRRGGGASAVTSPPRRRCRWPGHPP